jgi:hypothetical protein
VITACLEHRATTGVAPFMIGVTISGKAYAAIAPHCRLDQSSKKLFRTANTVFG